MRLRLIDGRDLFVARKIHKCQANLSKQHRRLRKPKLGGSGDVRVVAATERILERSTTTTTTAAAATATAAQHYITLHKVACSGKYNLTN